MGGGGGWELVKRGGKIGLRLGRDVGQSCGSTLPIARGGRWTYVLEIGNAKMDKKSTFLAKLEFSGKERERREGKKEKEREEKRREEKKERSL